jgi:transcriptional regulator with XRE-family HTH domain
MPPRRTQAAFREELPRLLAEREMSGRALAGAIGVNQSYLTFVLQGRRAPSRRLLEGTAKALKLPADHFREYREMIVVDALKNDAELLDRVYGMVKRKGGALVEHLPGQGGTP